MNTINLMAILSSALCIIPAGENEAAFSSRNISMEEATDLAVGSTASSFVGHPDTAAFIGKQFGVAKSPSPLFTGLKVGESFIAVPLANNTRKDGYTVDQAITDLAQLKFVLVTRIS